MERILPSAPIKKRLSDIAVGLASDCDDPERSVAIIMATRLPDATILPFVAVVTHEGKWVTGYNGGRTYSNFEKIVDYLEKSGKLDAPPEVRQKIAKLAEMAEKLAAKKSWAGAIKAVREAKSTFGRCEERKQIDAIAKQAHDWVEGQFATVIAAAVSGKKLAPGRKRLKAVIKAFGEEPQAKDAALGVDALSKLYRVRQVEARGLPAKELRPRTAKEFEGTRWTKVFDLPGEPKDEGEKK